jgi:hypothetical protein
MPILSQFARGKKLDFFLPYLPIDARILEVGSGDGWLGSALQERGWSDYTSVDCEASAEIVGDINQWRQLGLEAESVDVVIAFEVVEHGDFYQAFDDLLRPEGLLFLTSPLPHADGILKLMEWVGVNQRRTSPHSHLHYFRDLPKFDPVVVKRVALLSQWGVFRKAARLPEEHGREPE